MCSCVVHVTERGSAAQTRRNWCVDDSLLSTVGCANTQLHIVKEPLAVSSATAQRVTSSSARFPESTMGRALVAAAVAACSSILMPHAEAFVPAIHSIASAVSAFHGSGPAAGATYTRSRRPAASSSSVAIMKVAGAQPQRDAWLEGGVKTRELFNALSQGEIGKRAFTQALAKRMMSKATGMQQDYELSEAASLAASSSASVVSTADLRCESGVWFDRVGLVDFSQPYPPNKLGGVNACLDCSRSVQALLVVAWYRAYEW